MKNCFKALKLAIFCLTVTTANAQVVADDYAKSISAPAKQYVNVQGTKIFFLRSPDMFFTGNINKMVEFNDRQQPIAEVYFYEFPFKRKTNFNGGELTGTLPVKISGYDAKIEKYRNTGNRSLVLTFGDNTSLITVSVNFSLGGKEEEEKYIAFLQSIRYKKEVAIDYLSLALAARFSLDAGWFGYRSAGIIYGKYAFLPSCTPVSDRKGPRIYVSEYEKNSVDSVRWVDVFDYPDNIDETVMRIEDKKEDTVDGFKRYTLIAWVGKAPNQLMVYQTARTNGSLTVVFTATATDDFDKNLVWFSGIAGHLKIKEADFLEGNKK